MVDCLRGFKRQKLVGKIVKIAEDKNCELKDLDISLLKSIEPKITRDIYQVLDVKKSIKNKKSFGGTAPLMVKRAIKNARKVLIQN